MDENDRHFTVNGERYRAMLEDYLWPELDELDINDMWFKQDGATSHTARWVHSREQQVSLNEIDTDYKCKLFICWGIDPPNLGWQACLCVGTTPKKITYIQQKKKKFHNN